jgi:hypothetical protein
MVLKGSLREFILADIFNLIAQQKITGKLLLSTGECEGVIAFKAGVIAGAVKGDERLTTKLFNLITGVYHYAQEETEGLFSSYEKNLGGLLNEIIRLNLLPRDIVEPFAVSVVEDICCSFFSWTKGTYYFSSLPYVDDIAASCISITVENITMEAMRRVDEWNRMEKQIRPDTVFAPATRREQGTPCDIDPISQPVEYVFSKVDGASTVTTLFRSTCLTEYKVYESLNDLLNEHRIIPLSARISQAVVAALEKKEMEGRKTIHPATTLAAALFTLLIVLTICATGRFLVHDNMLYDADLNRRLTTIELPYAKIMQKVAIARVHYHALQGVPSPSDSALIGMGLVSRSDFPTAEELESIKKLYSNKKSNILYPGSGSPK